MPKPSEWQDFLSNDQNKYQICCLLANYFTSNDIVTKKTIYVTKGNKCIVKKINEECSEVIELSSTHRVADHRMISHAVYASSICEPVCIVADDTDIYILLLHIASKYSSTFFFQTRHKHVKSWYLLPQHYCTSTLTGSDITKPFYRRSKTQVFKKMQANTSSAKLLLSLKEKSANIKEVTDFILHTVYNRPKREKTPGDSRYAMLFVGKGNKKRFASTKSLPPDQKSLEKKILRANLISHSWINCLNGHYEQLDPCSYGYKVDNGIHVPFWFDADVLRNEESIKKTKIEEETCLESEHSVESDNDSIDIDCDQDVISYYEDSCEDDEN